MVKAKTRVRVNGKQITPTPLQMNLDMNPENAYLANTMLKEIAGAQIQTIVPMEVMGKE